MVNSMICPDQVIMCPNHIDYVSLSNLIVPPNEICVLIECIRGEGMPWRPQLAPPTCGSALARRCFVLVGDGSGVRDFRFEVWGFECGGPG